MKFVFLVVLTAISPLFAAEGVTLTVTVTDIPGVKGDMLIGLYNSVESFTDAPLPESPKITLVTKDDLVATIKNVKPGIYAIAVIQDLNQNGILDKNFLGIPKEPLAFSVIKKIPMGKPKFADCSFEVKEEDMALTIPLTVE